MILKYRGKENSTPKPAAVLSDAGAVLGKPELKDFLCIRVAGNEQKPLDFEGDYVKAGRGPLRTFDYSLEGDQDGYAVERKALGDFISSVVLTDNWKHELAKIERARSWLLPIVYILEFGFDDIAKYDYAVFKGGRVSSQFIYRRIAEMIFDLGIVVLFAGSRQGASYATTLILKRRHEALKATGASRAT